MDQNYEEEAKRIFKKAGKQVKGGFFKNWFSSKSERLEDGKTLYVQAGNLYKLSKNWDAAAQAYLKAAECDQKSKESPAEMLQEAANCMKKINNYDYVKLIDRAIQEFCKARRISTAATLQKDVAETLEKDYDYPAAIVAYEKAADLYGMQNQSMQSNGCQLKVADLSIISKGVGKSGQSESLIKAIKVGYYQSQIYESTGLQFSQKAVIKLGAKDYFFKAILGYLANDDLVGAQRAMLKFCDEDPTFEDSTQHKFLNKVINAVNQADEENFLEVMSEQQKRQNFDKVCLELLGRIRRSFIPASVNLMGEGGQFDFT